MTTIEKLQAAKASDEAIMLKACPWCNKAVQHRFALDISDGGTDDIIHAKPTDCGMQYFSVGSADRGVTVAAAWNQRPDSTLQAHTDRLAEAARLFIHYDSANDDDGVQMMLNYNAALMATKAALSKWEASN